MASRWYLTVTVATALLGGCDDKKTQPNPRVDEKPKTPVVDQSAKPADLPKTTTVGDAPKATPDTKAVTSAGPTIREQATALLGSLKAAVDAGKLAEASAALKQLDGMKENLPIDLSNRLETLRAAYKTWPGAAH